MTVRLTYFQRPEDCSLNDGSELGSIKILFLAVTFTFPVSSLFNFLLYSVENLIETLIVL